MLISRLSPPSQPHPFHSSAHQTYMERMDRPRSGRSRAECEFGGTRCGMGVVESGGQPTNHHQVCHVIVRRPNLEVETKRLLHQQVKILGWFLCHVAHGSVSLQLFLVVWIFLRPLGVICYDG